MRTTRFFLLAILILALVGPSTFQARQDTSKAKPTIKDVMKEAHKDGLLKKVVSGKADKGEQEKLLELYKALAESKPPKGEAKDWKEKTDAILKATKDLIGGEKAAAKELIKATNCKACHEAHKGE